MVRILSRRYQLQKKYIFVREIGKNLGSTDRSSQQKLNSIVPDATAINVYFKITININKKKEITIIDSGATENFIIRKYTKKQKYFI